MALITAKEEAEIAEYTKILEFRDLVLAGRHPRVKLRFEDFKSTSGSTTGYPLIFPPAPLTAMIPVQPGASQPPTSTSNSSSFTLPIHPARANPPTSINDQGRTIDPTQNYYRDLGVQPHVLRNAIEGGFKHYSFSSRFSNKAKQEWMSSENNTRKMVPAYWYRV